MHRGRNGINIRGGGLTVGWEAESVYSAGL